MAACYSTHRPSAPTRVSPISLSNRFIGCRRSRHGIPEGRAEISRWCKPPVYRVNKPPSPGRGEANNQFIMPSTQLSLHYHIVFGTKNHEPLIQAAWRGKLYAYLGGIIGTADGIAESIGGASDPVHLLIG